MANEYYVFGPDGSSPEWQGNLSLPEYVENNTDNAPLSVGPYYRDDWIVSNGTNVVACLSGANLHKEKTDEAKAIRAAIVGLRVSSNTSFPNFTVLSMTGTGPWDIQFVGWSGTTLTVTHQTTNLWNTEVNVNSALPISTSPRNIARGNSVKEALLTYAQMKYPYTSVMQYVSDIRETDIFIGGAETGWVAKNFWETKYFNDTSSFRPMHGRDPMWIAEEFAKGAFGGVGGTVYNARIEHELNGAYYDTFFRFNIYGLDKTYELRWEEMGSATTVDANYLDGSYAHTKRCEIEFVDGYVEAVYVKRHFNGGAWYWPWDEHSDLGTQHSVPTYNWNVGVLSAVETGTISTTPVGMFSMAGTEGDLVGFDNMLYTAMSGNGKSIVVAIAGDNLTGTKSAGFMARFYRDSLDDTVFQLERVQYFRLADGAFVGAANRVVNIDVSWDGREAAAAVIDSAGNSYVMVLGHNATDIVPNTTLVSDGGFTYFIDYEGGGGGLR